MQGWRSDSGEFVTAEEKILNALADGPKSSAQLGIATGLWSGTLFPALLDLEARKLVISEFADGPYPRRRIYRLPERNLF